MNVQAWREKLDLRGLQKLGKALMTPISLLPAAGLLLAIGNKLDIALIENAGGIIFDNLPILFAIGVAIGLANDGVAGIAALIGFLIMNVTMGTILGVSEEMIGDDPRYAMVVGIPTLQTGIFGGMLIGLLSAFLFRRYHDIELPQFLAFFGGKRFVPIITAVAALVIGLILPMIWVPIQNGMKTLSVFASGSGAGFATFIYGLIERALIPFGLHHIWNVPFYWEFGRYVTESGQVVTGDIPVFFAQLKDGADLTAGLFTTGRFPFMMFGLPAAALAMIHEAKPSKKKYVKGLMISAAFTSFLTGVTEPIEFSFLFVAPVLYAIHCVITASSFLVMYLLDVHIGHPFSGGAIDFVMFGVMPNQTPWWYAIIVGLILAPIYYFGFRFAIRKWDLKTPGREDDEEEEVNDKQSDQASLILEAIGGADNIEDVYACASRLRLALVDDTAVNEKKLKQLGASGVIKLGDGAVQVIFGSRSEIICDQIRRLLRKGG